MSCEERLADFDASETFGVIPTLEEVLFNAVSSGLVIIDTKRNGKVSGDCSCCDITFLKI